MADNLWDRIRKAGKSLTRMLRNSAKRQRNDTRKTESKKQVTARAQQRALDRKKRLGHFKDVAPALDVSSRKPIGPGGLSSPKSKPQKLPLKPRQFEFHGKNTSTKGWSEEEKQPESKPQLPPEQPKPPLPVRESPERKQQREETDRREAEELRQWREKEAEEQERKRQIPTPNPGPTLGREDIEDAEEQQASGPRHRYHHTKNINGHRVSWVSDRLEDQTPEESGLPPLPQQKTTPHKTETIGNKAPVKEKQPESKPQLPSGQPKPRPQPLPEQPEPEPQPQPERPKRTDETTGDREPKGFDAQQPGGGTGATDNSDKLLAEIKQLLAEQTQNLVDRLTEVIKQNSGYGP